MTQETRRAYQAATLDKVFSRLKTNIYSDPLKENYSKWLLALKEAFVESNYSSDEVYRFLWVTAEYLNNSIHNQAPYEAILCLEKTIGEWLGTESYAVVTDLSNRLDSFYLRWEPTKLYKEVYENLGVELEPSCEIIRLTMPNRLISDYLSHVALYHEVGHFIDLHYGITDGIMKAAAGNLGKGSIGEFHKEYLSNHHPEARSHVAEFFADIFSAQYVGNRIIDYLYLLGEQASSYTHPSTELRKVNIQKFLSNKSDIFEGAIVQFVEEKRNFRLENRFSKSLDKGFEAFVPVEIQNDQELHGIYDLIWQYWLDHSFMPNSDPVERLRTLNALAEKSISNYIVRQTWNGSIDL